MRNGEEPATSLRLPGERSIDKDMKKYLSHGILVFLGASSFMGWAGPPLWWSFGTPPVVDSTAPPASRGPANIGQAKWMAKNALDALRRVDPITAAAVEADLVGIGKPVPHWHPPATEDEKIAQKSVLLQGQLKALAAPFYNRLQARHPLWLASELASNGTASAGSPYPWTVSSDDDANRSVATTGQLKAVFSLRFETLAVNPPGGGNGGGGDNTGGNGGNGGSGNNFDDAVPHDPLLNWPRTPDGRFIWIPADPAGRDFRAVDMSEAGHILYTTLPPEDPEEEIDYRRNAVGRIWNPAEKAGERFRDIYFQPDSFSLNMIEAPPEDEEGDEDENKGERIVSSGVPLPISNSDTDNHRVGVKLHSVGADGSVLGNVAYQYSEDKGEHSEESTVRSSPQGGRYVFLWSRDSYGGCQLLGTNRGWRLHHYDEEAGVQETYTTNHAAGFLSEWNGERYATTALVFDQDSGTDPETDLVVSSYQLNEDGIPGRETGHAFFPNRPNVFAPGLGEYPALTGSGRLLISWASTGGKDITAVSDIAGMILVNEDFFTDSITDLPSGGWAIGTYDDNLQLPSGNGFVETGGAFGVLQFDRKGHGIGNGEAGRDIWSNGEWMTLAEATGVAGNAFLGMRPKEITPEGLIWVSAHNGMSNGVMMPVEISSLDRFVKGAVDLATIERFFGGLGRFGIQITGGGKVLGEATLAGSYIHNEDVLNSDAEANQPLGSIDQKSWKQDIIFYKKAGKLHFTTTTDSTGDIEIRLLKDGAVLGRAVHHLTYYPEVSSLIDELNRTFGEMPFANGGTIPRAAINAVRGVEYFDEGEGPEEPGGGGGPGGPLGGVAYGSFSENQYRNLTTRCMDSFYEQMQKQTPIILGVVRTGGEVVIKLAAAYATGYLKGLWGGLKSDWEGVVELANLLIHPIDSAQAIREGFQALLDLNFDQWVQLGQSMYESMLDSTKQALPWEYNGDNIADQVSLIAYINGYATGFIAEQALMVYLGAGVVSKVGQTIKAILSASKAGRLALELTAKGLNLPRNAARKAKASAKKVWSEFANDRGHLDRIAGDLAGSHRHPNKPGYQSAFQNSSRALGEALNELPELTLEKLFKELGDKAKFKELEKLDSRGINHVRLFMNRAGQIATALRKADALTEDALVGFARLYKRLALADDVPGGGTSIKDRTRDLAKLFNTKLPDLDVDMSAEDIKGAKALAKSLEKYKVDVEGNTDAKLWFRDVEKIYATGYRYSNFDPRFDVSGNFVPGPPRLKAVDAPSGGWYATFDEFDASAVAKPSLQMPPVSSAKFRLEFDWEAVKNNTRIPRGKNHEAEWFEMLAKDFPENGAGGGKQIVIEGIDIPIKSIWDISGPFPVRIY